MGQDYIDNDRMERFRVLLEAENETDLKRQMANMVERLKETATLKAEATGPTLEEVREELRKKFKEELYGKESK